MARFTDILKTRLEDTPKVPLAPVGSYQMKVVGNMSVQTRGEFEIVEFTLVGVAPVEDTVDMEELTSFGGAKNIRLRKSFLFPIDEAEETKFIQTQNDLKRFIRDHLGIGEEEAEDFSTAISLVPNRVCIAQVGHRQDKNNPEVFYAEIKKTMAAE